MCTQIVLLVQLIQRPTDAPNKMTHVNFLHVPTSGCHSQGDFQLKTPSQPLMWLLHRPRWNNENIKI